MTQWWEAHYDGSSEKAWPARLRVGAGEDSYPLCKILTRLGPFRFGQLSKWARQPITILNIYRHSFRQWYDDKSPSGQRLE